MIHSLRFRLFLALLVVAVLSVILVALFAGLGTVGQFARYVNQQDRQEQNVIATVIEYQLREGGLESIDPVAGILEEAYGQDITLTSPEGDVLYSTAGGVEIIEERIVVSSSEENLNGASEPDNTADGEADPVPLPDFNGQGAITTTTRIDSSSENSFF
ncbi:MAG: hypothetical protein R3293_24960, partial [Candidatus Promineifilaceae bacterium]|nr:hypothetical protein [Candidatus Promineifilaceae bacterium]